MPITSAATSMSRIAIQLRPMCPRTRFLAASVSTTAIVSTNRYRSRGDSIVQPNISIGAVDTEPDGE